MLAVTTTRSLIVAQSCSTIVCRSSSSRAIPRCPVDPRQQQQELLAAHPGRQPVLDVVDRRLEQLGHLAQHLVTDGVRQRVVDPLEVVEVDQADGEDGTAATGLAQQVVEAGVEVPPVVQPGQRVAPGQLTEVVAAAAGLRRLEDRVQGLRPAVPLHGPHLDVGQVVVAVASRTPRGRRRWRAYSSACSLQHVDGPPGQGVLRASRSARSSAAWPASTSPVCAVPR